MPEFIFVLGKNAELSTAEITSYLDARRVWFSICDRTDEFLVVSAGGLPETMHSDLGGTLKSGEILACAGSKEDILEFLDSVGWEKLAAGLPDKPLFTVSSYGAGHAGELMKRVKKNLKAVGIRAGMLTNKGLAASHTEVVRRGLAGREFLLCKGERFWLGRTVAAHDPFEFRKRDVGRPAQRVELSMPPRLARIMLNLSGRPGEVLDPFCGLGTVLQEAALLGFRAHGSDVDSGIVGKAVENMEWLKNNCQIKNPPEVERADARNLPWPDGRFDAVVTEPVLGPALKSYPKARQAEAIVRKLGPLYRDSLKEMLRVLKTKGRMVMTSPMFRVHGEVHRLDVGGMARELGAGEIDVLEGKIPHRFPLTDFEPRHRTLREVHIIEK
jgi:tRNA G10  N-methylase Trm11